MSCQPNKKGKVRFAYSPEQTAKKVCVAGSFNDWKPETMRKQKSGEYVKNITLQAGTHEYKFVVDGSWQHDPENEQCSQNEMGTLNSVAVVS